MEKSAEDQAAQDKEAADKVAADKALADLTAGRDGLAGERDAMKAERDTLKAEEVVETFPCSRRMAELRFSAATGHSILEEILAIRVEKAQKLRAAGLKDEAVAQMCGYSVRSSLHRLLEKSKSRSRMGLQRDG